MKYIFKNFNNLHKLLLVYLMTYISYIGIVTRFENKQVLWMGTFKQICVYLAVNESCMRLEISFPQFNLSLQRQLSYPRNLFSFIQTCPFSLAWPSQIFSNTLTWMSCQWEFYAKYPLLNFIWVYNYSSILKAPQNLIYSNFPIQPGLAITAVFKHFIKEVFDRRPLL